MLTNNQIKEIREHLEKAQNPLFFFDNDNDGLISFLLLRRFLGRGMGVVIKSFPELNLSYYKKVEELNPDYIFILDKFMVSDEFLEKAKTNNLPVVWIDHHESKKILKSNDFIYYYNPFLIDKKNEPVSYLCYKIINNKKDIWLALIGCISDCYLPDFYKDFKKNFLELGLQKKNPTAFDLFFNSEIGKIARILDFSLKDSTTNVLKMMKFMISAKSPQDILEENKYTKQIFNRYNEINKKYQELILKARKVATEKILYFQYAGNLSLSSNLANQLIHEFPDKLIVVIYFKDDFANISLRGKGDIKELTAKFIKDIPGAIGGGHKNATGAKINSEYLSKFKENIKKHLI